MMTENVKLSQSNILAFSPDMSLRRKRNLAGGGDISGVQCMENVAERKMRKERSKKDRKNRPEVTKLLLEVSVALVSQVYRVPVQQLLEAGRENGDAVRARQITMYLCSVGCQLTQKEIACYFDRTCKTVRHACHLVEDWRDDPGFDERMEDLETCLHSIATRSRKLFQQAAL